MGSAKATRQKGQPAAPEWHALTGKHQLINFTGQLNLAPNKSDEHDKQKTAGHKNDRTSTAKQRKENRWTEGNVTLSTLLTDKEMAMMSIRVVMKETAVGESEK